MTRKAKTSYINCPHCGSNMRTSGHITLSPLLKQLTATCQNADCLFSSKINIEIFHQLQPSLHPKPEILGQLKGNPR